MPTGSAVPRRARGFAYVGVLLLAAAVGIGLAAAGELWRTQSQREREAELLRIGAEFRRAIASYHGQRVAGAALYPARLEDLVEDRRGAALRRHLRRIYVDPMTGRREWGLIRTADGRIRGVHSLSQAEPIRRSNFEPADTAFEEAARYSDWRFEYVPRLAPGTTPRR